MRIGVWMRRFGAVAVAACVAVGTFLTVRIIRPPNQVTRPTGELTVQVASGEKSAASGVLEVEVGPPAAYARSGYDPYAPSVVSTPRHVQLVDVAPVALPASPYVLE
jgi:negative regulator of sigma E activity